MVDWILDYELQLRAGSFGFVLCLMALWEILGARRPLTVPKRGRWLANLLLVAFDAALIRAVFPAAAVGGAWIAAERGWGLFNSTPAPAWVAILASIVFLDFVVYVQHVIFHRIPVLWRLHMVHHADQDFDVTTGTRFHPIEMLLSLLLKLAVVAIIGAPAIAVFLFEVILNATAMFNHGNVRLPVALDRVLRWFVVTPDMHRVHHSVAMRECHRNFGFNLPWWDRLLGTYLDQPALGHQGMTIGLTEFKTGARQTLAWMLALPFGRIVGGRPMRGGHLKP